MTGFSSSCLWDSEAETLSLKHTDIYALTDREVVKSNSSWYKVFRTPWGDQLVAEVAHLLPQVLWRRRELSFVCSQHFSLIHQHPLSLLLIYTVYLFYHNLLLVWSETNNKSHTASIVQYVLNWIELTISSSTTLSLVFLCFTLFLPPSLIPVCVALFSSVSIQFSSMGFIDLKFDKCHPRTLKQKLINLNKSRCQPSLHLFLSTLAPFLSFSLLSFLLLFVF